ncbi:VWA domain-containing protein [Candidatus Kapabacteria bacterium]|nr:VWA domain-containing protein [Candidatus Kapabacteria bacterium]
MFRFENEIYQWALLLVPVVLILYIVARLKSRSMLKNFADTKFINVLASDSSKSKHLVKFILLTLALASIVLGLMNMQFGTKLEEIEREGIEIIVAMDISNSMLAEDIQPSRIERAKQSVLKLIDNVYNDKLGLIIFAGESFLQLPITTDYSAAKLLVSTISTDLIPTQGTAIGSSIELAMESFSDNEVNKVLIIITDGENHEDDALGRAEEAVEKGIFVNTIGMGSVKGAPIPIYQNGIKAGFRKDRSGETVVTKLNEGMLRQIATTGNGRFIRASGADLNLKAILDDLENIEKTKFDTKVFTDFEDQFQWFFGFALLLLLVEFIISYRKNKVIGKLLNFAEGK